MDSDYIAKCETFFFDIFVFWSVFIKLDDLTH